MIRHIDHAERVHFKLSYLMRTPKSPKGDFRRITKVPFRGFRGRGMGNYEVRVKS
jgi:hypothetical protein